MQQDNETLYFELMDLGRSYNPEKEKEILPKIKEWTSFFITANSIGDSKTQTYILSKKPYLSKKLLKAADCLPFHRLAAIETELTEEDIELLDALLSSGTFYLTDENTIKHQAIQTALASGNLAFFSALKQLNCLEFFSEILRERYKVKNLINKLHYDGDENLIMLATLLALEVYKPTDEELSSIQYWLLHDGANSLYEIHQGNKIYQLFLIACFRFDRIVRSGTITVTHKQYFDFPLLTRYIENNYNSIILSIGYHRIYPILTYAVATRNLSLARYLTTISIFDDIKKAEGKPLIKEFFCIVESCFIAESADPRFFHTSKWSFRPEKRNEIILLFKIYKIIFGIENLRKIQPLVKNLEELFPDTECAEDFSQQIVCAEFTCDFT